MTALPPRWADKTMPATCTVWIGSTNSKGYGLATRDGKLELAHRVAWEAEKGPIPEGMVLDHRCRVRNCVTLAHLDLVTVAENSRRGRVAGGLHVGDTCINGHEICPGGLYVKPSGATECRECRSGKHGAGRKRPSTRRSADVVRDAIAPARNADPAKQAAS